MTNFYSPETCKQLEQLGCVASSGVYYGVFPGRKELVLGRKVTDRGNGEYFMPLDAVRENSGWEVARPLQAFQNADFTASQSAKDNLIRVFGEKSATYTITKQLGSVHGVGFVTGKEQKNWEVLAHKLLDIILSGGDGESFIKEALEEK